MEFKRKGSSPKVQFLITPFPCKGQRLVPVAFLLDKEKPRGRGWKGLRISEMTEGDKWSLSIILLHYETKFCTNKWRMLFIKQVNKVQITAVKRLKSWRFERQPFVIRSDDVIEFFGSPKQITWWSREFSFCLSLFMPSYARAENKISKELFSGNHHVVCIG